MTYSECNTGLSEDVMLGFKVLGSEKGPRLVHAEWEVVPLLNC